MQKTTVTEEAERTTVAIGVIRALAVRFYGYSLDQATKAACEGGFDVIALRQAIAELGDQVATAIYEDAVQPEEINLDDATYINDQVSPVVTVDCLIAYLSVKRNADPDVGAMRVVYSQLRHDLTNISIKYDLNAEGDDRFVVVLR